MNLLINDDFRNHLHLLKNTTIITDPPYNQKYHYGKYKDNLKAVDYNDLLATAFANRDCCIVHYPEFVINNLPAITKTQCNEHVAWVYNSNTAKQHRSITWWGNAVADFKKVGQPYKNPTDKRIKQRIKQGKMAKLYDWWNINQVKNVSKKNNPHPCPIPYELAEKMVLLTTNEGDIVCDPFAGSGTVLLAAKNNKRNYIGFEIDETYYNYAREVLGD